MFSHCRDLIKNSGMCCCIYITNPIHPTSEVHEWMHTQTPTHTLLHHSRGEGATRRSESRRWGPGRNRKRRLSKNRHDRKSHYAPSPQAPPPSPPYKYVGEGLGPGGHTEDDLHTEGNTPGVERQTECLLPYSRGGISK